MDNLSFKSRIIKAAGEGGAIITPTGRLARRLRHLARLGLAAGGPRGFRPPDAVSLNSWLKRTYLASWPNLAPATGLQCLRYAARALEEAPPPGDLTVGLALGELLDETFGTLAKNGLLGAETPYPTEIIEWRNRAFSVFQSLLREARLIHPSLLAREVSNLIRKDRVRPENGMVLAGLRPAALTERLLVDLLVKECGALGVDLPAGSASGARAFALPDRGQEVQWVVEAVLKDGASREHHRIGVVATNDYTYHPMFRQCFEETAAYPAGGAGLAFNVSSPSPSLGHPLCAAALLPLEFILEDEPEEKLFSLFMSPYYGAWPEKRMLSRSRKIWREKGIVKGLFSLMSALSPSPEIMDAASSHGGLDMAGVLKMFEPRARRPVLEWARRLKEVLRALGFPVPAGEEDEIASSHLFEVLGELSAELGGEETDLMGFYLWLKKGLEKRLMAPAREETAGFQVLGRIEALGLFFERLYVVGLTADDLPGRPSPNPLLTPGERRSVAEANPRGRVNTARSDFTNWLAAAKEVVLTRPKTVDREPAPRSPFWPEDDTDARMDLWASPGPGWLRAGWLRSGWEGLESPTSPSSFREEPRLSGFAAGELSVSEMESFLQCPFRYFGQWVLKLACLPEPALGLHPKDRGTIIHRILASFTRRARKLGLEPHASPDECLDVLREEVARCLGETGRDRVLDMESARLLGDSEMEGLLVLWLREEAQNWTEGHRWLKEEEEFSGLHVPGLGSTVRGRVDRIDLDPEGRPVLWDYKTGGVPAKKEVTKKLTEPQLPLYLMAQRAGLLADMKEGAGAGYICLNFKDGGARRLLVRAEELDEMLAGWEDFIAKRAAKLREGDFRPDPHPERNLEKKPCQYCDLKGVCGVWTMEEH